MEERMEVSRDSTTEVDTMQWRHIVGNLCYLINTRPDLVFAAGYVNQFMQQSIAIDDRAPVGRQVDLTLRCGYLRLWLCTT